jgi:hypothetical protein
MADGTVGLGSGPPGKWILLQTGTSVLPNGSPETKASNSFVPAVGQILVAFVGTDGATNEAVHNDNTNLNPGTNDVHWSVKGPGDGTLALFLRTGSQAGSTVNWAVYGFNP